MSRPGKGGGRKGSPAEDLERRSLDIVRRLRGLAKLLLEEVGVEHLPPGDLEGLVRLGLDSQGDPDRAGDLVTSLRERIKEWAFLGRAIRPGRVYCFRCESAACSHAVPADAEEVFTGYSPTGRPLWADFITWCIDRRVPNIDRVLQGGTLVLARAVPGRELCRDQLDLFGGNNSVYRIAGQVTAGFFDLRRGEDLLRAALSTQIILARYPDGRPRLLVNPVCGVDFARGADPALASIISQAARSLELLSLRLAGLEKNGSEQVVENVVNPFLGTLAREMEHHARSGYRRTGHARMRSRQRRRPTELAYPDAREAMDEDLLVDTLEATVIVTGPRGRTHVFGRDGRHVTSLRYSAEALRRRLQTGRWRPAEAPERGSFRAALRRLEDEVTGMELEEEAEKERDR